MTPDIYVKTADLYDFIWDHHDKLIRKEAVIAENKDTGYEIRVSADPAANDRAIFRVFRQGKEVQTEDAIGEDEVFDTYRMLNLQYLFPVTVVEPEDPLGLLTSGMKDEPDDEPDFNKLMEECHEWIDLTEEPDSKVELIKDAIALREDDLVQATRDFMEVLAEDDLVPLNAKEEDELLREVLEHVLIYLSVKHNISVWRPDIYTKENGEQYLDPYPYTQDS